MPESASTDSLMARPVSPVPDDDQDLFRTFLNQSQEYTLRPLGASPSETSISSPARPYSAEEQDIEDLPENPVRHAKGLRNLISDWNLELIALISSTVSLSALIILLARQDGQPLSTWTLPLSLNTVVSLLSVIIKTPLAFIVGTCLGQGKWAWFSKRQGPLSAHWVCFGAGITIALLAIGPFLQGLVQYVGKMSSTAESGASMMHSHGLDVGECPQDYLAGPEIAPGRRFRHLEYAALVATFLPSLRSSYGQDRDSPALIRATGYANESYGCMAVGSKTDLRVVFRPNDTYSFRNWDTLLASFAVLHVQEEYWSKKIKWNDTKVYATECALRYCIQVYKPTMTSGKIDEGLIPVPFERVSSSWQPEQTDPSAHEAIKSTVGTSLALVNEFHCLVIPRNDL
ncbi:hypothetical protein MRS44_009061 [Fusarium solani]|uniref:uncharacterized protein n=1 Tax=Fusarium solani TaxID=169388 RepID=UPI0032C47A66|nr:hypothetical protein MRS44_009061 [Fusarium solani]